MVLGIIQWLVIISLSLGAWALLRQAILMTRRSPHRDEVGRLMPKGQRARPADAANLGADTKPLGI
jgi:hypothetical protein